VQPDDACQAAEHLALAALAQHRHIVALDVGTGGKTGRGFVHLAYFMDPAGGVEWRGAASSRALRSLSRNWVALATYVA